MLGRETKAFSATPGTLYWVTGLAGVGKKTLARAVATALIRAGRTVLVLDGGGLRKVLGARYGYGPSDRRAAAMLYARLCAELTEQGHDVVIATVSMFHEVRHWSRAHLASYCEIYLRASPQLLAERRPKGLIAAAMAGRLRNVPGVDLAIEEPEAPDIRIEVEPSMTQRDVAEMVLASLVDRGLIASSGVAGRGVEAEEAVQ